MHAMTSEIKAKVEDIASAVMSAFPKLSEAEQRMSLALYRLLSYGEPVIPRQISETTGIARRIVRDAIARLPGIKRNSDGAIVGHCGLSVLPTKHRFLVEGRELYAWCAWDTLFIPELLDATAQV